MAMQGNTWERVCMCAHAALAGSMAPNRAGDHLAPAALTIAAFTRGSSRANIRCDHAGVVNSQHSLTAAGAVVAIADMPFPHSSWLVVNDSASARRQTHTLRQGIR